MSKDNSQNPDVLRPAETNDIPFAIEIGKEEEVADSKAGTEDSVAQEDVIAEEDVSATNETNDSLGENSDATTAPAPRSASSNRKKKTSPTGAQSKKNSSQISLREFLFGDFILGTFLRKQIKYILFLVVLCICYISNRYASQQEIIEEGQLRQELVEKKNFALTQYAELTMMSRQSGIEERLRACGDTLLKAPNEPPFIIEK
ncbi:MAG: hypothetical protein K6C30_02150 [Bacteroidaceae bacterium]|nr:hypothetical protein [Bacteroidaceae bacterium]